MRFRLRLFLVALALVARGAVGCVDPEQPIAQPRVGAPNPASLVPLDDGSDLVGLDATLDDAAPPIETGPPPPPQASCDGSDLSCLGPCPNGQSGALLRGTVHDPAGKVPMPNVVVYIPTSRTRLPPLPTGTSSCEICPPIPPFVVAGLTDQDGNFQLQAAPSGRNIPLVIQDGAWRRQVVLDDVVNCSENAADPELTRLPRNRAEGDLPQMAVLTSGCDDMACFLRRVGVDASEFTAPHGGGRVDVYRGVGGGDLGGDAGGRAGDCTTLSCPLWSSKASLEAYNDVLLGCECDGNNQTKSLAAFVAVHDWLDEGGLLLATHSQVTWFQNGLPDFKQLATWTYGPPSGAPGPFSIDTTTARGNTFLRWVTDMSTANTTGTIALNPAQVSTSMSGVNSPAVSWVNAQAADVLVDGSAEPTEGPKLVSFGAPVGGIPDAGPNMTTCGTGIISDIHVGGHGIPGPTSVPDDCSIANLSPGELALEYFLFASNNVCVQQGTTPPFPP